MYRGKRALDLGLAVVALPIAVAALLPVVAVLAVAQGPGSILFRQARPGKDGRLFTLYKLQTMMPDSGGVPRVTPLGRWLRALALDELPQLWNIIKGDMSWVGPRPLLPEYLPLYNAEQARRHTVRPGLTGWAQVHGRNATTWPQRLALDVWYVDHASLGLDLRILLLTVKRLVVPAAKGNQNIMAPWRGNGV